MKYIVNLDEVNLSNLDIVGGKNASTGEMIQKLARIGIKVPGGFATTIAAYRQFLTQHKLDKKIASLLSSVKTHNLAALTKASRQIQAWIVATPFLPDFEEEIASAYARLKSGSVAVRSSANTEDLASASFAGAQETYLNISGLKNVMQAIKLVYASLYTSRAIAYRYEQKFPHDSCALSVGIQPMIRSDKGASGVVFTLDTESGFDQVVLITGSYGLGQAIVQGIVNPDEFIVYKPALNAGKPAILQRNLGNKMQKMVYTTSKNPRKSIKTVAVPKQEQLQFCITDKDIQTLAHQAMLIEQHYGKPMDLEWAKDGLTGELYILQARPETVMSQKSRKKSYERFKLSKKGQVLAKGLSIGQAIGAGTARLIHDPKKMHSIKPGEVLVTDMTDPDWEPVMKMASAIVTNRGGRTCHAAIVARELGIPAVIGCGNATSTVRDGEQVTVSCAEGQIGYVYAGKLPFQHTNIAIEEMPRLPVRLCLNVGNPEKAFVNQSLPNDGVGLARLEFIIGTMIGVHPNAVLNFKKLSRPLQQKILQRSSPYKNPVEFYIEKLREGISMIAAAFNPKEVIFRFSDFKSNEYANLVGGNEYEPIEENPMLGFRGASRYSSKQFRNCFELECKAFKRVREESGLTNAQLMVPFVRTVAELRDVLAVMEAYGLKRGENGLKVYMMCEIPSNVLLASEFLKYVDGFSIGSNDLTQLTLGLDRDSQIISSLFDERNEAVKILLSQAIAECRKMNKYIGICGQAPSDYPELAEWLMKEGIQSMSLNPDTIVETWLRLGKMAETLDPTFC